MGGGWVVGKGVDERMDGGREDKIGRETGLDPKSTRSAEEGRHPAMSMVKERSDLKITGLGT